jgi:hypothetical protein
MTMPADDRAQRRHSPYLVLVMALRGLKLEKGRCLDQTASIPGWRVNVNRIYIFVETGEILAINHFLLLMYPRVSRSSKRQRNFSAVGAGEGLCP